MKRFRCLIPGLMLFLASLVHAQYPGYNGTCYLPGKHVLTQGLSSTTLVTSVFPKCTVTVYNTGTLTTPSIYSSPGGAALSNPFQAASDGSFLFFALSASCYDITLSASTSGGTPPMPGTFTFTDVCLSGSGAGAPFGGVNLQTNSYLAIGADSGKTVAMNCPGACTFTLPNPIPSSIWSVFVENISATPLTVSRNGLLLDGGVTNLTLALNQGVFLTTDGANFFTQRGVGGGGGGISGTGNPNDVVVWLSTTSVMADDAFNYVNTGAAAKLTIGSGLGLQGELLLCSAGAHGICNAILPYGGSVNLQYQLPNQSGTFAVAANPPLNYDPVTGSTGINLASGQLANNSGSAGFANPAAFPGPVNMPTTTVDPGPFTVQGTNPMFEIPPDPFCFFFGTGNQDQFCNLLGIPVWNATGVSNLAFLLVKYSDYANTQPPPNGTLIFFNALTGQFEFFSGNSGGGSKSLVEDTGGNLSWSTSAGLGDPGANGIVKRTGLNVTAIAGPADVDALYTGAGKCYLFKGTTPGTNDGCDTPAASLPPALAATTNGISVTGQSTGGIVLNVTNVDVGQIPATFNAITATTVDLTDWNVNAVLKASVDKNGSIHVAGNQGISGTTTSATGLSYICGQDSTAITGCTVSFRGADHNAGSGAETAGIATFRGGNNQSSVNSASAKAGDAHVWGGALNNATPGALAVEGNLDFAPAFKGTPTAGLLTCYNGTSQTLVACATTAANLTWVGISNTVAGGSVNVTTMGDVTATFDASITATAGDIVCVSTTTAGDVFDSVATLCPTPRAYVGRVKYQAATGTSAVISIDHNPQSLTPTVVGSGTAAMTTAAITAGNCGTTVTVAATGVATTDTITWAFNAAPAGSNAGVVAWPTANNVNFAYCPGVAETPAAATINWRVLR